MDLEQFELPVEILSLRAGFPRGIYELQTEGIDYEVVLDPILGYLGALLVDETPGEPEEDGRRLSLVALHVEVGQPAEFVIQGDDLSLKVRSTPAVRSIQLIELLES